MSEVDCWRLLRRPAVGLKMAFFFITFSVLMASESNTVSSSSSSSSSSPSKELTRPLLSLWPTAESSRFGPPFLGPWFLWSSGSWSSSWSSWYSSSSTLLPRKKTIEKKLSFQKIRQIAACQYHLGQLWTNRLRWPLWWCRCIGSWYLIEQ